MIDIVERLRFDAARCEASFSKGVAGNIEEAAREIERLRARTAPAADGEVEVLCQRLETVGWHTHREDNCAAVKKAAALIRRLVAERDEALRKCQGKPGGSVP